MISLEQRERFRRYTLSVLIALDRLVNAIWWGHNDETISSRFGRAAVANKWWGLAGEKVVDWLMNEPGHCRACITR